MNKWFKNFPFRSVPLIALLGAILISYTHCIHPEGGKKTGLRFQSENQSTSTDRTPSSSNSSEDHTTTSNGVTQFNETSASIAAYQRTVYPILRDRCILCHNNLQQPFHAAGNVTTAHNAARPLAQFNNVNNSRLVLKLNQELHNCWSNCSANAQTIARAIEDWRDEVESARQDFLAQHDEDEILMENQRKRTRDSLNFEQERASGDTPSGTFSLNLDSANLGAPMMQYNQGGLDFLATPENAMNISTSNDGRAGTATFSFSVSESDTYKMWGYVHGQTGNSDSFFVNFNNGFFYEWHFGSSNEFRWRELTHTSSNLDVLFYLASERTHQLQIRQRESGARISQIILTNDPSFDPREQSILSTVTLRYDISQLVGLPNSWFEIDVEDYNAHAYKFSSPRLRIPGQQQIRVQGIHIAVNGNINPQNSTYTIVNETATISAPELSNRSMIVLKERGNDDDRFAFEFDVLELLP